MHVRPWISLSCRLLGPALLFSIAACGGSDPPGSQTTSSSTTSEGSGGKGGSGTTSTTATGGSDAGLPCPAGSHMGTSGDCEAELTGWTDGPKMKRARDHHVTFVAETPAGPFIYVAAGVGAVSAPLQIERATINPDGTLSAFEDIEKLPVGLIGPGLAQVDRSFVLGGGLTVSSNSTASTYVGKIGDDGHVTITQGPDMASSRYHVSFAYAKGFVFALGGLYQKVNGTAVTQEVLDVIERASFDGTTLGAWETLAPLPAKLTHHATIVRDGALYVIGGGDMTALPDIRRATVGDDGSLGAWETIGKLPAGRASPAATVFLDQLYVISGMTSLTGGEVDTVLAGAFDGTGALGTFSELAKLPKARAHSHQAPFYNGYLYSAGGSINHAPQNDVYIGKLQ